MSKNMQYFNKPATSSYAAEATSCPTPPHQDGYYFMINPQSAVPLSAAPLQHCSTTAPLQQHHCITATSTATATVQQHCSSIVEALQHFSTAAAPYVWCGRLRCGLLWNQLTRITVASGAFPGSSACGTVRGGVL